ncbi:hypothetical protein GCM10009555_059910 [Acrocarpospora macrocephala]|uniref:Tyr recombinase domain-containing protein n=1 Tax=Acrocarpospora macrocephala TaxID=150177 RepID=A0A5M3WU42_9ACTN|nr:hypothetical protein [Acrocarpospora macrocephala]GES10143.1 hypothetical protein Amac_037400 [Acrocarpospora macrocephala]
MPLDIRSLALNRALVSGWVNALHTGAAQPVDSDGRIRKPLAASTIHNLHGLLYAILQYAVEAEPPLRRSNPAARTQLPSADDEGDKACFLTPEEFALLRSCADDDIQDALTVLAGTGLRYSEFAALQVRDVHLGTQPAPQIRRAWRRQPDNTFRLGPPKTPAARRRVTLPEQVLATIQPHLKDKKPETFLFTTTTGRWWRHSAFYHRR